MSASAAEKAAPLAGDDVVPDADVSMDRAFDLPAAPEVVWPWLVQLGKGRAGWYLTRRVERLVPPRRRGVRTVEPRWQGLAVGDVVPDWGGSFEVMSLDPGRSVVYRSQRGHSTFSWAITLRPSGSGSRVQLRLRIAPLKRRWLAKVGEAFDVLTVVGLAAGLRERL